ncbi:HupE/UreJ family protein [Vibrio superstes]|uniref:Urease accessory protein n=1 Tax=Vibrio superstes NBRC 103154 TaxID=1219062 RepID=A0A511QP37_9VIBR|nr:HupE/UreJ family protein [Vibrio superstes]GEM79095.1 urease accessory protein [Vibrio superstes NBRC 103154]
MKKIGIFALSMCPGLALAHPSHAEAGFVSGFIHPFTGIDHLAAMFGVGLICSLFFSKEKNFKWAILLVLASSLGVGALLAVVGLKLQFIEAMITLSVVCVGMLLLLGGLGRSINQWTVCGLAVLSAFHGYVHILEGSGVMNFGQYALGFIISSIALYFAGLSLGNKLTSVLDKQKLCMLSGGAYMLVGLALGL